MAEIKATMVVALHDGGSGDNDVKCGEVDETVESSKVHWRFILVLVWPHVSCQPTRKPLLYATRLSTDGPEHCMQKNIPWTSDANNAGSRGV